jgi:hypothetical protein
VSPGPHTVAGRHAADRARERDSRPALVARRAAIDQLVTAIRAHGLPHFADLTARPNVEPGIGVNVRLDRITADEALVFALLDERGWRITTGRHGTYGHHLFCVHEATGAEVVLHVKVPHAAVPQWEPA